MFNTSLQIHLIIALLILLLAETVGLWFLQSKMIIAGDRQYAAFWVYQCSVLTMMASIINVPFNASIIAHERMSVFAYISIFEVISKLGIVYLLMIFLCSVAFCGAVADAVCLYALLCTPF